LAAQIGGQRWKSPISNIEIVLKRQIFV